MVEAGSEPVGVDGGASVDGGADRPGEPDHARLGGPQNHRSLRKRGNYGSRQPGEPLEPGRFYDLTFDLQPDDQIIPAGKRVGLMIFSSDRDFTVWPAPAPS